MANTPNQSSERKEREGFFNSIWADITGGAITIVSGLVAARHAVNKAFYQNIKIAPDIGGAASGEGAAAGIGEKVKPVIEESKDATRDILRKVREAGTREEKRKILMHELPKQHKNHSKEIDKVLSEHYAIESLVDRARLLRPHQKLEVLTKVGATMAVTLGAVATVAALREMTQNQKEMDARLDTLEANTNGRSL